MATPSDITQRILVVDDEPTVCDSVRRLLEFDHHTVEIATSSQQALAAFQPGKFELIIVDYEMPLMKGDKLAAAIRAQAPQQAIIMMTAYGESLRLAGSFPLEVDLVLSKPFDLDQLRQAVRQIAAGT